ncbi:DUF2807 domain-containing protein [Aureisphaera sp. CAU 1614]|uniref:DUF2807 domain-containing protein n=1 Tax=Halomarinibacterium sedimenti TaxID=2857106 RepID=A0A9X1JUK3_9FLAO|nr:DUF2807 domain-containing protein [Halomarinibacterium sedimenti]MBW2936725.1 DUF2807 domain-containing protein [Halomarinibacterium sedimenti]
MMKNLFYISILFLIFGCDSENAPDCFQSAGDMLEEVYEVDDFNSIIVWDRVKLVLVEGPEKRVMVRSGKNLFNEIRVRVEDSILKVSDRNSCNFVRDIDEGTTVFVTVLADTLKIRNSSGLTVENIGRLKNHKIVLISEDQFEEDEFHIDGDFNLDNIDVSTIEILANGLSTFRLQGVARSVSYVLSDGDVRVEAEELITDKVFVSHRSTNKIIVYPVERISGVIQGIGDVISKNRPPFVKVEELYTGRLIFE